jgi:hypothetical protein
MPVTRFSERDRMVKAIRELPEKADIEDAMERLYLMFKVEKGLQQVKNGKVMPHDMVKEKMRKWLE